MTKRWLDNHYASGVKNGTRRRAIRIFDESVVLLLAVLALGIGAAIYIFDRGGDALFVSPALRLVALENSFLSPISGCLPSFLHTFSFCIFSALLLAKTRRSVRIVCGSWVALEAALELAQTSAVALWISNSMPVWTRDVFVFESVRTYFLSGTYDVIDLVAVALGGYAAFLAMRNPGTY